MKPFEDSIPEEQAKQNEEFITLMRQTYRPDPSFFGDEQQKKVAQVEARLAKLQEERVARTFVETPGSFGHKPQSELDRNRGQAPILRILAAVLVGCLLIGGTVLVFVRVHAGSVQKTVLAGPIGARVGPVGKPVTVNVQWAGLEMSMSVTSGPYFLGELLAVDLSLTNQTHPTMIFTGQVNDGACGGSALYPSQTGGIAPHYALYTLPVPFIYNCPAAGPGMGDRLSAGQTVTTNVYEVLTASGNVTLTGNASFYLTKTSFQGSPGPLTGHLPVLHLNVRPQTPSDRVFSLQQQDAEVMVQAPSDLHLVALAYVLCQDSSDHSSPDGYNEWTQLATHTLQRPACSEFGNWTATLWKYAIGAAGYAVVQGQLGE
jgi:hypothetical protein